ncbi:MAG: TonB family protein [Ignavibacteriaceae bacterium]
MPVIKNFRANLRAKYSRYIKLSIIFTLAIIIAAFKFSPQKIESELIILPPSPPINIYEMPKSIQKPKPPPPLDIQPQDYFDDEPIEEIELDDIEIGMNEQLAPPPPLREPKLADDEPIIFVVVEQLPEPIGGMSAIQEKVYYTEIAKRIEIEGTVVVEAVVDKQGNIIDAFVQKSIGGGLDQVALDAVKNTRFHPGKQRGKPVNVRIWIPIKFVLK